MIKLNRGAVISPNVATLFASELFAIFYRAISTTFWAIKWIYRISNI